MSGGDNGGVCAVATSRSLDSRDNILRLLEVDPSICTETEAKLLLLLAAIDSDDPQTADLGVLDSKMTETSSSTGEDNPVSVLGLAVFDGAVDGDTLG